MLKEKWRREERKEEGKTNNPKEEGNERKSVLMHMYICRVTSTCMHEKGPHDRGTKGEERNECSA